MTAKREAIQRFLRTTGRVIVSSFNAALVFGGAGVVSYGAWSIYQPAGFIVLGAALFWLGLPDK